MVVAKYGYPGSRSRNAGANPTPGRTINYGGETKDLNSVKDDTSSPLTSSMFVFGMAALAGLVMLGPSALRGRRR